MALTQITGPYPIFTDLDGTPLDDGYLYIGEANEDPVTNPVQVFFDANLTIPATQPIRTNNGYAYRNGTPALIYTAGPFSITIRNKRDEFVLYSPVGYGFDPAAMSASVVQNDFTGNGVQVAFVLSASPSTKLATSVFINGVYQEKDSYTLAGNTITFSIAPPLNSSIEIMTNETGVINSGNATAISYTASFTGATAQTVQTKLEQYVSVKDFGAVGNGVANDTAAFNAAFAVNSRIYIPAGTYIVDTLNIPGVYGFELIGAGQNRTILQASAANQKILRKEIAAGAVEYGYIGHFSLKAHAAGSTGTAFDCSGFRQVKFAHINGLSNGSNGFASLFSVAAAPYLTYGCIWDCPTLAEQTGWIKVFDFNNNSTSAANNANASIILNPWIYANVGLSIALDLARSTQTNVIGGLIEGNTGATAIRWGQANYINGMWLENNGTDLVPGLLADGTGNNVKIIGNYLSSNPAINLAGVSNCYILQNTAPVAVTFSNVGNNVCFTENNPTIATPTVARSSGNTGTLTLVSTTQTERIGISGCITYELLYTWNADTAATNTAFAVTIPAGWGTTSVAVSSVRDASGEPGRTASNLANIYHYNQYDDNTSLLISVRMQKT